MRLAFDPLARENAALYQSNDPALWKQIQAALAAIADGAPQARESALRVIAGHTAWLITVKVHGRDQTYQIVWAEHGMQPDVAVIVHLGPAL